MTSISDQLQQMLEQRAGQAPNIAKNYSSALNQAAGQDQSSIDQLRGIYSDPSKFTQSVTGALGLGLMAGNKSGSFNEGLFNGLAAATDTKNYNQQQNLSREEKLAKLGALEAQLTRQKAQDQLGVYDASGKVITNMQGDQQTMADLQLQGHPLPMANRALNPGEQGPSGPNDPLQQSMTIYNDYTRNPGKYAGPQGQAMVKNALDYIQQERINQRYMAVADIRADAAGKKAGAVGPGQAAVDKKFGGELADWYNTGGEADYQKQMAQLGSVHDRLTDKNKETTGAITGRLPDFVNSWINPEAINSREQVAEVVQRNLKNILGSQFTQKEGDNLISRAYNPALDEATNARRVNALMTQMQKAHEIKTAAIKYFEENGTLSGFSYNLPTMDDFNRAVDNADSDQGGGGDQSGGDSGSPPPVAAPPQAAIDELMKDPSPQGQAHFDEVFGSGAAQRILSGGK